MFICCLHRVQCKERQEEGASAPQLPRDSFHLVSAAARTRGLYGLGNKATWHQGTLSSYPRLHSHAAQDLLGRATPRPPKRSSYMSTGGKGNRTYWPHSIVHHSQSVVEPEPNSRPLSSPNPCSFHYNVWPPQTDRICFTFLKKRNFRDRIIYRL